MTVEVTDLGSQGQGVARLAGRVVFVPGALPGELVAARIRDQTPSWARAALSAVLKPSPDRTAPFCPVAGRCGGCQLQHLSLSGQERAKRQRVVSALVRFGGVERPEVLPLTPSPRDRGYRHKVALVPWGSPGALRLGFYAPGSHRVVTHPSCPVHAPAGEAAAHALLDAVNALRIPAWAGPGEAGRLRHVVVRTSRARGETMGILVMSRLLPGEEDLLARRLAGDARLTSVYVNLNDSPGNAILGPRFVHVAGARVLWERSGDLEFPLSPGSFFQVNPAAAELLLAAAEEAAALTGTQRILDLFAGVGVMTLRLGRRARTALGIEAAGDAVADGRQAVERAGLQGVELRQGDAAEAVAELGAAGERFDLVTLDPPRRGAPEVLEGLLGLGAPRILYVSCDPVTLARDVRTLAAGGYHLAWARPFDLFPHTAHVETLAELVR